MAGDERTRRRAAYDDQLLRDLFHDRPERTAGEDEAAEHHDEQDDKTDCRKHGTGTSPLAHARLISDNDRDARGLTSFRRSLVTGAVITLCSLTARAGCVGGSGERLVGREGVSTCRSRWVPVEYKN